MSYFDCLIVGGGHAGAQAAILLKQLKYGGTVGLLSAEPSFPYERPPLSKDYLAGEKSFERLLLRPPGFWNERSIQMMLGERVASLDPDARTVQTTAAREIGYGKLIWAAAARPAPSPAPGRPPAASTRSAPVPMPMP